MNDYEEHQSGVSNAYCVENFLSYFPYSSLENKDSKYSFDQQIEGVGELNEDTSLRVFPVLRFGDINLDGYKDLLINVKNRDKKKMIVF